MHGEGQQEGEIATVRTAKPVQPTSTQTHQTRATAVHA
jgi:hypothetical protein